MDELDREEAALIEKGKVSVVEMGAALKQIRDKRLYREQAPTFNTFCRQRFGLEPETTDLLIRASEVSEGGAA